jgi:hypothetical protein
MKSQAQRRLMYAAASKKGGAGGVSQSVAKEFVAADKPGKLPERKGKVLYDHPRSKKE